MENIFSFDIEWDFKKISLFVFLLILPNFLGMINIGTQIGFKIHFFQVAVFISALIYGPKGGMLSGLIGSSYSAFLMGNPYIAVGNAILGFFTGLFAKKMHTLSAVLLAFLIQLPWLILTDYYLIGLPWKFIGSLIVALLVSNVVWAIVAHYSSKSIQKAL